jgi:hypothetical protein
MWGSNTQLAAVAEAQEEATLECARPGHDSCLVMRQNRIECRKVALQGEHWVMVRPHIESLGEAVGSVGRAPSIPAPDSEAFLYEDHYGVRMMLKAA